MAYGPDFDQDAFFATLAATGLNKYAGQIAPRNEFNSDWWTYYNLRIEQEFPAFRETHKLAGWITINNLCNLLNNEWCVLQEAGYPRNQTFVDVALSEDGSQYVYDNLTEPAGQGRVSQPSSWEIVIGLTYQF